MSYRINRGWTRLPVCVQYTGVRGSSEGAFYIGGEGRGGKAGARTALCLFCGCTNEPTAKSLLPCFSDFRFTYFLKDTLIRLFIPLMMKALVDLRIMTIEGRRMAKAPDALE